MSFLIQHWADIVSAISTVVSGAAAVAALTPTPKDDNAVAKVRRVIDVLAFNWGNARNKGNKD